MRNNRKNLSEKNICINVSGLSQNQFAVSAARDGFMMDYDLMREEN